ncbi:hypothetical protein TWF694_008898 [Orbilia ellipsospora]|uniref:Cytochrome P450 n=1 Tax=Orbilia ellipsospora TaxID=2528407 RepID=A0AAV9XD86_9PEZI
MASPIIRVGPNQLSINDPDYYDIIYTAGYKFPVDPAYYTAVGGPVDSVFGLSDHVAHRARRGALNHFLSKVNVHKRDQLLQNRIGTLVDRISSQAKASEDPPNLSELLGCLTVDIITEYSYGQSWHALDTKDTRSEVPLYLVLETIKSWFQVSRWLWPLQFLFHALPFWFSNMVAPRNAKGLLRLEKLVDDLADECIDNRGKNLTSKNIHATVFEASLKADSSSYKLTPSAIRGDAVSVVGAGVDTTRTTLMMAVYAASVDQSIQQRLHDELVEAFPQGFDGMTFKACERLPYLTAFIKECLRMWPASPSVLPRKVPKEGLWCRESFIPGGTTVAMCIYLMHQVETAFPNPKTFDPARWLAEDDSTLREKYFVPFSKGPKICLGIHLAYAELYMTLAALFRRFNFKLHPDNSITGDWKDHIMIEVQGNLVVTVEEYDD